MAQSNSPSPIPNDNSNSSPSHDFPSTTSVGNQLHSAEVDLAAKGKARRIPTFKPNDDLISVREVSAAQAHIAKYGEVQMSFDKAAERANPNPNLSAKVTCKRL